MRSLKESNPQRQKVGWGVFSGDRASASEDEEVLEMAVVIAAQQYEWA